MEVCRGTTWESVVAANSVWWKGWSGVEGGVGHARSQVNESGWEVGCTASQNKCASILDHAPNLCRRSAIVNEM